MNVQSGQNHNDTMAQAKTTKKNMIIKIFIGLGIIGLIGGGIYGYYLYQLWYPSTQDAYVKAKLINISPKVSGYIQKVHVQNNEHVQKGDVLVTIKPKDYQIALKKAKHQLAMAKQKKQNALKEIKIAKANIKQAQSTYQFTQKLAKRYKHLHENNAGSLQNAQKYESKNKRAKQTLTQARLSLQQAKSKYDQAKAKVGMAKSDLNEAQNQLSHTTIKAPSAGYVTQMAIYKGQLVGKGEQLFGFVATGNWWIKANFKETALARIQKGQKVEIELDMYDHTYHGEVISIGYASGTTFSLLPAQNASGNWVKVTQRFPVKIEIRNNSQYPLRVGASTSVTINTLK
jgi:membrane fusion protein (multidrug efflux system)